jgi:hypothetical protein
MESKESRGCSNPIDILQRVKNRMSDDKD